MIDLHHCDSSISAGCHHPSAVIVVQYSVILAFSLHVARHRVRLIGAAQKRASGHALLDLTCRGLGCRRVNIIKAHWQSPCRRPWCENAGYISLRHCSGGQAIVFLKMVRVTQDMVE
jgi:hypothetical protein